VGYVDAPGARRLARSSGANRWATEEEDQVSRRYLVLSLILFGIIGCSERNQVTLEFRIAEAEPGPGLTGMVFDPTGERFYLHEEVLVSQSDVDSAVAIMRDGRWDVELVLTSAGAQKFEELTERNVGKRCGMVINGELVSAPLIMAPIHVGRAIVAGDFTEAEARRVAQQLSLP
jgi:preprotein translocase subunit SecD